MCATRGARRALIIGEVLFDRFPDGSRVLGGAPFNVAWHLRGFGADPLFVSRVGEDDSGAQVRAAMQAWGMDGSGLQSDPSRPTGAVQVSLAGGQPSFEILPDQAYDHLDTAELRRRLADPQFALVYQGSLILRSPALRDALFAALREFPLPLFVDVNLREPWWRPQDLPVLLARARWVKMNDAELEVTAGLLGLEETDMTARACRLCRSHDIELLILTRGGEGALACGPQGLLAEVRPEAGLEVVDTVGAGDAFAAVVLLGLMQRWPLSITLDRAQAFASRICRIRGATTDERGLYEACIAQWR